MKKKLAMVTLFQARRIVKQLPTAQGVAVWLIRSYFQVNLKKLRAYMSALVTEVKFLRMGQQLS
jgi:hypothetical protein